MRLFVRLSIVATLLSSPALAQSIRLEGSNLKVYGSGADDTLIVRRESFHQPWGSFDYLHATVETGGTTLSASYPTWQVHYIYMLGGSGDDLILNETSIPSTLHGFLGDDVVFGGSGDDVLSGYHGFDRLYGRAGNDALIGFDDHFSSAEWPDVLEGGPGRDRFTFGPGDWIYDPAFAPGDGQHLASSGSTLDPLSLWWPFKGFHGE